MDDKHHNIKSGLNSDLRSIDSIYRMIVVAGLRSKQLVKGARPKVLPDPLCRRNISIALEEARRGLIHFTVIKKVAAVDLVVPPGLSSPTRETIA
jgi:DNA-directed RNA polymerase subunit K/omega